MSFMSFLRSVEVTYTLISAQGTPRRAVCVLTLEEIGLAKKRQNPTSGSPHSRHTHTLVAGDSLASVAHRQLGNPGAWREIAELNDIDDPSRVRTGSSVLLPARDTT
ncbi:hypothetical protein ABZY03_30505 [Streptomyces klenkii]|uniref:hypothetical protein n=1 Tax=Streptomyces klenkii TaxID=1420899 RepID=UPI0033B6EC38